MLARSASFNKFVCLDDDFLLHPKWAEAVEEVRGDFDVATSIILNPDLSRYCDWVNIIENYTFLRAYHEMFDKCSVCDRRVRHLQRFHLPRAFME